MPKKKIGKHLQFYKICIKTGMMPCMGLCGCSYYDYIDEDKLELFKPDCASKFSFWASGLENDACYIFTPLRQTIVLFMAAIKNEL